MAARSAAETTQLARMLELERILDNGLSNPPYQRFDLTPTSEQVTMFLLRCARPFLRHWAERGSLPLKCLKREGRLRGKQGTEAAKTHCRRRRRPAPVAPVAPVEPVGPAAVAEPQVAVE